MNYKKVTPCAAVILTIIFCIIVLIFEKQSLKHAQLQLEEHASIISDDIWNFNYSSATAYLRLAVKSDSYEKLVVTDHGGRIFQGINKQKISYIKQTLVKIHLIPRVKLVAQIEYHGNIIGWIDVVWLPTSIFILAYVFFALVMVLVVVYLYTRILQEKESLEESVRIRTNELYQSNVQLKNEIVERSRAESALMESEEKHRLLAENISDVIWTMDMDLNYTYISPVSMRLHGWSAEELENLTIKDSLTPESIENVMKVFQRELRLASEAGDYSRSVTMEVEMYNKDGSTMWSEITATSLVNEENKPYGLLGVTRDITERINALKEKEELQIQLDHSRKMESLGLLAGGVAHDLNNVLSGIVSYPELLLLDLPYDSPLRAPIETIKESGLRAAAIVQDLLTLARRGVVTSEILMLNTVITNYLESPDFQELISYHPHITVNIKLEENLPNIKGSGIHILKTVMNLVSNAAEAQPHGGSITICTKSCFLDKRLHKYNTIKSGEYVVFSVADNGDGISKNDIQRIFEPFYTKKVMGRSGTGLGLSVVWGTVQDHNGVINVKSNAGQGTEFELFFPMSRELIPVKETQLSINSLMGDQEKILIVDDMKEQREIATNLLQRLNYNVSAVSSGEKAVEYLKTNSADLVILDMIMDPGIDGYETFKQIKELNPNQKAIIASGYSESDSVKKAQDHGAGGYVKKPYMLESISYAIKKELSR